MGTRKFEMHEGPEAWDRFRKAMEAIVSLRKQDLPPRIERTKRKPEILGRTTKNAPKR